MRTEFHRTRALIIRTLTWTPPLHVSNSSSSTTTTIYSDLRRASSSPERTNGVPQGRLVRLPPAVLLLRSGSPKASKGVSHSRLVDGPFLPADGLHLFDVAHRVLIAVGALVLRDLDVDVIAELSLLALLSSTGGLVR